MRLTSLIIWWYDCRGGGENTKKWIKIQADWKKGIIFGNTASFNERCYCCLSLHVYKNWNGRRGLGGGKVYEWGTLLASIARVERLSMWWWSSHRINREVAFVSWIWSDCCVFYFCITFSLIYLFISFDARMCRILLHITFFHFLHTSTWNEKVPTIRVCSAGTVN